jgi:hypothetical protein
VCEGVRAAGSWCVLVPLGALSRHNACAPSKRRGPTHNTPQPAQPGARRRARAAAARDGGGGRHRARASRHADARRGVPRAGGVHGGQLPGHPHGAAAGARRVCWRVPVCVCARRPLTAPHRAARCRVASRLAAPAPAFCARTAACNKHKEPHAPAPSLVALFSFVLLDPATNRPTAVPPLAPQTEQVRCAHVHVVRVACERSGDGVFCPEPTARGCWWHARRSTRGQPSARPLPHSASRRATHPRSEGANTSVSSTKPRHDRVSQACAATAHRLPPLPLGRPAVCCKRPCVRLPVHAPCAHAQCPPAARRTWMKPSLLPHS